MPIRSVLGAIFLYAGIVKASASQQFVLALVPFTILPGEWLGNIAVALAWTEIAAGALILLPRVHLAGAVLISLLCVMFIGILAWAISTGLILSCGCFGADETPSTFKMILSIARDIVLLLLAIATIVIPRAAGRR